MSENLGIRPLGRAVLVEHYQPERRDSLIELPETVAGTDALVEQRARVLAIGPSAWPHEPPRAKVGDRVLISKFGGYLAKRPADGRLLRFVNDQDIFAAIDDNWESA